MANDSSGNVGFGPVLGILRQIQEDNMSILKAVEANNERSPLGGLVAVTWRPEPDVRPLINLIRDRPPSDDPNENPNMDKLIQWIGTPFDGKRIRILNIDSKGTNIEADTDLDLWMLFRRIQQGDLELPKFRDVLSIQFDNPGSPHSPAEEPPQADPEKNPVVRRSPQPDPKATTPGPGGKISPRAPVGSPRPAGPWTPPAPKPPIRPGVGEPSGEPSGGPSNPGRASRPGHPPRPNIGVPPGGPKDPKAPAPAPRRPEVGVRPGSRDDPIVLVVDGNDDENQGDEDEPNDDVSDIGSQHDSPVLDALGVNQILDDPEHWRKVCQFFLQTDPSFHDIIVPGLKRPLRPHQAAVVYWLLTSLCDAKVAGPMLSDEMGLGKSFDVISITVIYAYLHLMWQDCRTLSKPDGQKVWNRMSMLLQLRFNSASRRIVTSQEDSPSIIICLANLVTTWMTEWEKFVDTSVGSPAAGMKLHTNVDAQRLNRAYYKKDADIVPLTSSNHRDHWKFVPNPDDPADVGILINGFPGGSQHVILTTPRSIDKLKDAYDIDIRHRDSRKPDLSVNMLAPAWIFMDEVHKYLEQKLLGGARMEVGPSREKNSAFWLSQRCTTFPTLAKLWMDESVGHDRFDGSKMEELAADFNGAYLKHLGDPAIIRTRTIQALTDSPFYKHRKILRDESEKFLELCKSIDEILRLKDPNTKQPYPGPSDGSLLRHMVVFCETPITAYLVAMLLFCQYRNIDVLLFHATLPFKSSKTRPWLSRETILHNFSADCRPGDNPKVLIGKFNLLAEGLNLQRANYAVLIDLARERQREQARDRIARQGQTQKTFIYQFWASNNIFEVQRRDRNRTEAILGSSSKWFKADGTAIDWAYFGLDDSSEVSLNDESEAGQDNAGGDEFDDIYD
ncbi:hypothetical protein SCUP515_10438 [Seiridium cupressi]